MDLLLSRMVEWQEAGLSTVTIFEETLLMFGVLLVDKISSDVKPVQPFEENPT